MRDSSLIKRWVLRVLAGVAIGVALQAWRARSADLIWLNGTGAPITNTSAGVLWVVPDGRTDYPLTLDFLGVFNGLGVGTIDVLSDWVRIDGVNGLLTQARKDTVANSPWGGYWQGFTVVFCAGLLGLGARWVRSVIISGSTVD